MLKRATIKSEVRNPKSEIRTKFESKSENGKTGSKDSSVLAARNLGPAGDANRHRRVACKVLCFSYFHLGIFPFVSDFGFRISDLGFRIWRGACISCWPCMAAA